jgi:hypothetical protein
MCRIEFSGVILLQISSKIRLEILKLFTAGIKLLFFRHLWLLLLLMRRMVPRWHSILIADPHLMLLMVLWRRWIVTVMTRIHVGWHLSWHVLWSRMHLLMCFHHAMVRHWAISISLAWRLVSTSFIKPLGCWLRLSHLRGLWLHGVISTSSVHRRVLRSIHRRWNKIINILAHWFHLRCLHLRGHSLHSCPSASHHVHRWTHVLIWRKLLLIPLPHHRHSLVLIFIK